MRPTFRLQHTQCWVVNLQPKGVDSLPYSKMQNICRRHRQRLLASREAPRAPGALPPATLLICEPTPSYVLSPELAARLSKFDRSSLASKLTVYDVVPTGKFEDGASRRLKQGNCTPEVLIDQGLSGDQGIYYGPGQIHVIGMLDIHRAGMIKGPKLASNADLQSWLAQELLHQLPSGSQGPVANPPDGPGSWILCNTDKGLRKTAYIRTDVNRFEGIATASVTLNINVPIAGTEPDRTCPYNRIEAGPFTSIWGSNEFPAWGLHEDPVTYAPPGPGSATRSLSGQWIDALARTMQRAMDVGPLSETVDHARALGESDPDLVDDEDAGRQPTTRTRRFRGII